MIEILKKEFNINPATWWLFFVDKNNPNDSKRFGITKEHFLFKAKIKFGNNKECENYLVKKWEEYIEQFNKFSEIPEEKIITINDK